MAEFIPAEELSAGFSEEQRTKLENWPRLIELRDGVLKVLESARKKKVIGNPLEACVRLRANPNWVPLLETYKDFLPTLMIVSQVEFSSDTLPSDLDTVVGGLDIRVERARGEKCNRCWTYSSQVGEEEQYPGVCLRCAAVLRGIEASVS